MEKQQTSKIIQCCADAIALYNGKLVLIERLTEPKGLALPGGRLEYGENLKQCILREFKEETGLRLNVIKQFGTYSDPNRDPRGHKVSTVFIGRASGKIKEEVGKTKITLIDFNKYKLYRNKFVFDHYQIINDLVKKQVENHAKQMEKAIY